MPSRTVVTCPCGATVEYDNPNVGAVNVGHFEKATGWVGTHDMITQESIWVCPECKAKTLANVRQIVELFGTPYISLAPFLR